MEVEKSTAAQVLSGVPQGLVLGPPHIKPTKMHDVFVGQLCRRSVALLEGAPGSGKNNTSACQQRQQGILVHAVVKVCCILWFNYQILH